MPPGEDLVALWRVRDGRRFRNYRATFTRLDEASVSRASLNDVLTGNATPSTSRPRAWSRWAEPGAYSPLITRRVEVRSREEQRPNTTAGIEMVQTIHRHFFHDPYRFEACAVDIWRRCSPSTSTVDLTRPYRDGERDSVGTYLLGPPADRLAVEFALEAKCYAQLTPSASAT